MNIEKNTGIIRTFIPNRKFGFILRDDGTEFFFHQINFEKGTPALGQRVEFELGDPVKLGMPKQAVNITIVVTSTNEVNS
jgi:cold shock CspA family protein